MIEKDFILRLENLPIEQVAERLGIRVDRHKCRCPFHDDRNPSMTFNTKTNKFRCWACGEHGGTIDLVMRFFGVGFVKACEWLAEGSCAIIDNHRKINEKKKEEDKKFDENKYLRYFFEPRLSEKALHFLKNERKISRYVIAYSRLNSWVSTKTGTEWLSIPYFNIDGRLIGVQHRNLDYQKGKENYESKFRFPAGSQCHTYNLPILRMVPKNGHLWIAEGCTDCWALLSAGRHAIAIPSATTVKKKDMMMIKEIQERKNLTIHMAPDNDAPGENLFLIIKGYFPNVIRHQLLSGYKDFSQWWAAREL